MALRLALSRRFVQGGGLTEPARGKGGKTEFRDHRLYAEGDDLGRLDWNVYGRLGELHIKRFQADADVEILIRLDVSASMSFGPKDQMARRLVAGLCFGLCAQQRPVRVETVASELSVVGPCVRREADALRMLEALEALPTPAGILNSRTFVMRRGPQAKNQLIYLISDFLDDIDTSYDGFGAKEGQLGISCAMFAVLAHEERDPKPGGRVRLVDYEGRGDLDLTLDAKTCEAYRRLLDAQLKEHHRLAVSRAGVFEVVPAEGEFDEILLRHFAAGGAPK